MANTTFTGAVRSKNGFQQVTKNETTGTVSQKQFEIQTVPTSGVNNVVDTNGFSGTATAAGANNASLERARLSLALRPTRTALALLMLLLTLLLTRLVAQSRQLFLLTFTAGLLDQPQLTVLLVSELLLIRTLRN